MTQENWRQRVLLWLQPDPRNSGKGGESQEFLFNTDLHFSARTLAAAVSGQQLPRFSHCPCSAPHKAMQTMARCCQDLLRPWSTRPEKPWQVLPKRLKLRTDVQSHLILLRKLWPVADDFFSPAFQVICSQSLPALSRLPKNAAELLAIPRLLEKATAPRFSFQSSWKNCKSTSNLQENGREC